MQLKIRCLFLFFFSSFLCYVASLSKKKNTSENKYYFNYLEYFSKRFLIEECVCTGSSLRKFEHNKRYFR
jgi:hypothetical protein